MNTIMKTRKIALMLGVTAALNLVLAWNAAAISTSFDPSSDAVGVGDNFSVALRATTSGSESMLGWDFNLSFDSSQMQLKSWTPGGNWNAVPSVDPLGIAGLTFPDPLSGNSILLGTFYFQCLNPGVSTIGLMGSTDADLAAQQGILLWTDANGDPGGVVPIGGWKPGTATITQRWSNAPAFDPGTAWLMWPGLFACFAASVRRGFRR